ncbi:MAG: hypothetical protein AAF790_02615 [Planctomycetota bacterium]
MKHLRRLCRAAPPWAVLLTIAALAAGINAVLVSLNPPVPRVHDEFSYLLAADTFASGRLTNPTHTHWPHFETMHVIQKPSYQAKYPPGQAVLLAAGQRLLGDPIAGVCLATGLCAAASVWMLRAFAPPVWAAIGGLLVALHAGIQLQWGMCFWGGALAMAAGSLVVGGAARLARRHAPLAGAASAFAAGAVGLAVTRPFEGFISVCMAAVVVAGVWITRGGPTWRAVAVGVIAPAGLIGAVGLGLIGTYNAAVTGTPLKMPYMVYERDYGVTPIFVWQQPNLEQRYLNPVLERFNYAAAMWSYRQQQTWQGLLTMKTWFSRCVLEFFFQAPVALALLAAGWVRRRWLLPWLAVALTTWAAACMTVWMFPHYLAPVAPVLLLLTVTGLRTFRTLERRLPPGRRWLTPTLLAAQAALFAAAAYDQVDASRTTWAHGRHAFEQQLLSTPGEDLVMVRYRPDHNVHDEWVYNRADIDNAPVVWARELNAESDCRLIDYFAGRRVWLMLADERPLRLMPYPGPPREAPSPDAATGPSRGLATAGAGLGRAAE